MRSTKYLYDCDPIDFIDLPYIYALRFKLTRARMLYNELYMKDIEHDRQFHVQKAIRHNEALVREAEGGEI